MLVGVDPVLIVASEVDEEKGEAILVSAGPAAVAFCSAVAANAAARFCASFHANAIAEAGVTRGMGEKHSAAGLVPVVNDDDKRGVS